MVHRVPLGIACQEKEDWPYGKSWPTWVFSLEMSDSRTVALGVRRTRSEQVGQLEEVGALLCHRPPLRNRDRLEKVLGLLTHLCCWNAQGWARA